MVTDSEVEMHFVEGIHTLKVTSSEKGTAFLRSDAAATIFFAALFCAATIQGRHFFLQTTHRHQRPLDKVCTSNTLTTAKHCQ